MRGLTPAEYRVLEQVAALDAGLEPAAARPTTAEVTALDRLQAQGRIVAAPTRAGARYRRPSLTPVGREAMAIHAALAAGRGLR